MARSKIALVGAGNIGGTLAHLAGLKELGEDATPVRIEMRAVSLGSPPSGYRLTLSAKSRMAATTLGEGG